MNRLLLVAAVAPLLTVLPAAGHPPGLQPGDTYHIVFATSTTHGITSSTIVPPPSSRFGGLDAADWIVTEAAFNSTGLATGEDTGEQPPLGIPRNAWMGAPHDAEQPWDLITSTWTAILSTGTVNARDRVTIAGPVYNTAGQLVATSHADFFDGQLENAVGFDEFGDAVAGDVWTGSFSNGNRTLERCTNWTSNSSSLGGTTANPQQASNPLHAGTLNCNRSARLYALGPAITVPYPADFDGSGAVDGEDLAIWTAAFGLTDAGDADSDGDTDGADLLVWQRQLNAPPTTIGVVPEPGALTMALAALACGALRRRARD